MSHTTIHRIKWTSRILAVLYILFFSVFALDVFAQGYTFQETMLALFMSLLPAFFLIIATIVAWYRPALGGVWFVFLGLVSIFFFNTHTSWVSFILISLPAFIIGGLFLWIDLGYDEIEYDDEQKPQQAMG